ncbi:MAG TPA: amidohydrolase family protein [Dehalococcoidia bacterium]|nr:amidohydrolase family protein [Dehalococcoidia bacterium]
MSIIMLDMLIDFHNHIFPQEIIQKREDYCRLDSFFAQLYSDPRSRMATVDDLINSMDENQIDRAVVVNINWVNPGPCIQVNDYILDCVARYPQRLVGLCGIPFSSDESALKEIDKCLAQGACGAGEIRLDLLDIPGFKSTLKDVAYFITEKKFVLMLHSSEPVGHQYAGKGNATPDVLLNFIQAYPDLNIVCAHLGGGLPFYAFMPEVRKALRNVYFDLAAVPFLYEPLVLKTINDVIHSDKLLFGSDFPLMSPGRVLQYLYAAHLDKHDLEKILGKNAAGLIPT